MQRRPNIVSAGTDLAFAALAFAAGLIDAPPAVAIAVAAGSAVTWAWTRRAPLARMDLRRRVTNSALALGMIGVVMALLYWIGLLFGGHT